MTTKRWIGSVSTSAGDYSVAANWSPTNVPVASDDVYISADDSENVTSGLNQSAVAVDEFRIERGYTGTIASSTGYLRIDPNRVVFEGSGTSYIDTETTAGKDVTVYGAAAAAAGKRGLYLMGTIGVLTVNSGKVAFCGLPGESDTVTDVRTSGATADVLMGVDSTHTNIDCLSGTIKTRSANATTDIKLWSGTVTHEGKGAVTNVHIYGGTFIANGAGTITNLYLRGGIADFSQNAESRTVSNVYLYRGGTFVYDPDSVTVSAFNGTDGPSRITITPL